MSVLGSIVKWFVVLVALAAIGLLIAGQVGALRGTPPADLGVRDGRLKAPSATPNSVSSQTALWPGHPRADDARIEPLPLVGGDAARTMARLREIVEQMPGGRVVAADGDYLRAEFTTKWLRFVDDVEFWLNRDRGVVDVRSASRLGKSDLGANRQRIEAIRTALGGAPG